MFEFLFKYPGAVFEKGQFVFLAPWPVWALACAIAAAAALLLWHVRRNHAMLTGARPAAIWLLESGMVALVLLLLWQPAVSVATLRPQQNVVAVLIDDSRSMAIREGAATRLEQASAALNAGLLDQLRKRFQVRLYRFGKDLERVPELARVRADSPATHIGGSLKRALAEASTLPLGAVVLVSDGADNSGGIDLDTISEIRRRRIPIHTVGVGREKFERDIEITDATLPPRALPNSRITATVAFRHAGFAGRKARLAVREGARVLAAREIALKGDGVQTENLVFDAGAAGPRGLEISIDPLPGEENNRNNAITRLVNVLDAKPRILYIEGEPRWEFKFIRRAAEEDANLQLVTMLRTTPNKIYRQGIGDPKELEEGFPAKAEELFAYQGLIIGSVEAGYFTPAQQELIKEFAGRRGGGVLFLGGRYALSEGGWARSQTAEIIPLRLPEAKGTFHREQSGQDLTVAGRACVICRLEEDPERNAERWKKMPLLANYNDTGEAKPGAVVLMETVPAGKRRAPLLALENYGRGRAAVFATGGSWRWKMLQDHADRTHQIFWQQLMRWLAAESPGTVVSSTPQPVLADEARVRLRAEVRDKDFRPRANVTVEARVMGPEGAGGTVPLAPQPLEEGVYTAEWNAQQPGSYVAEIVARREREEIGRDVLAFRREDGVAENFGVTQNRELLEKLAQQTGGRYYTASTAARLGTEISYSEAGITTRETRDLWNMPAVFLLALLLRGSEWLLRRMWGVV